VLNELLRRVEATESLAIVADGEMALAKVRRALDLGHLTDRLRRVELVSTEDRAELFATVRRTGTAFFWPGTPEWVEKALPPHVQRFRPSRIISDESLGRIQAAVLDAAIRQAKGAGRPE